jgi:hypothetical protein
MKLSPTVMRVSTMENTSSSSIGSSKRIVTFAHTAAPLPEPGANVNGMDNDTKSPSLTVARSTKDT